MTQELKTPLPAEPGARMKNKRPYRKPVLTRFGDIRTRTLAPTVTLESESGGPGPYKYTIP